MFSHCSLESLLIEDRRNLSKRRKLVAKWSVSVGNMYLKDKYIDVQIVNISNLYLDLIHRETRIAEIIQFTFTFS
jgi:hypothetical protein